MANEASTNPTRIYLPSLPLSLRFFTFRDSNGILLTINNDNISVNSTSKDVEPVNELRSADCELCPAIITDMTASAFAGVGKPLNVVACVVSRLNMASLNAAQTGIITGIIRIRVSFKPSDITIAGANSASELLSSL